MSALKAQPLLLRWLLTEGISQMYVKRNSTKAKGEDNVLNSIVSPSFFSKD